MPSKFRACAGAPRATTALITARTSREVISVIGRLPQAGRNSRRMSRSTSRPLRSLASLSLMKSSATTANEFALAVLGKPLALLFEPGVDASPDQLEPRAGALTRLLEHERPVLAEGSPRGIFGTGVSRDQNE